MTWQSGPITQMDDDPHLRHDDSLCIDFACPYEALLEEGVRISYCAEHLRKYSAYSGSGGYTLAEMKERPVVVHSATLSLRERAWLPLTWRDMGAEWPQVSKVEAWAGFYVHQNEGEDAWTWRSVAMAMRTFPDRPIRLVGSMLIIPQQAPLDARAG